MIHSQTIDGLTCRLKRRSLRQAIGAIWYDLPRFAWLMLPFFRNRWVSLRNRNDNLSSDSRGLGVRCNWEWTSDLHIAHIFPQFGLTLMRRAFRDWPVVLGCNQTATDAPRVSFIIGHRGLRRIPHLLMTLQSIASQVDVAFECVVIEQSNEREIEDLLPEWVRYFHTTLPDPDMPYSRSWAFNVGAELARGQFLIFHDNDMLVPRDYAAQMVARHNEGYDVINLKRFVFYLNQEHSERAMSTGFLAIDTAPESVVQNLEAGGSFGIARDAFFDIGGFDESFVGWGGEDNEFWQRAQTRNVWPFGYMPILHLWHEAQPEKHDRNRSTIDLLESRSAVPAERRIEELRQHNFEQAKSEEWHRLQL